MRRTSASALSAVLGASWLLCGAPAGAIRAQGAGGRPERRVADHELQVRINQAIDRGIERLQSVQREDGSWRYEPSGSMGPAFEQQDFTGGLTALALYALAASGVRPDAAAIVRGVGWTEEHPRPFGADGTKATYASSLLVLALTRIDAKGHRRRVARLAHDLCAAQLRNGMWSYRLDGNATVAGGVLPAAPSLELASLDPGDNSNSQFAVLALWSAQVLGGISVPQKTWTRVRELYERTQQSDGGWMYRSLEEGAAAPAWLQVTPTMTGAGLVSYTTAAAALRGGVEGLPDARASRVAERGLMAFFAGRARWSYRNYYLAYTIERVATVLDVPAEAWYPQGARALLDQQREDGRWTAAGPREPRGHGDADNVYETALALLFLCKATAYPITRPRER